MRKVICSTVCVALVFSTLTFGGCAKKDKASLNTKDKIENIKLYNEKDKAVDLDLYFDSSKSEKKVEVGEEERLVEKDTIIGELIVDELIKGPSVESKLKPILPKDTRLLSFSIKDKVAYINLSEEAKVEMTPAKEEATLRSIVLSLTQLPSINKVKIQIANKDTDVLGGNFDISKPFGKDDINAIRKK